MSRTASKRVVLILDCCYSGAFARGSAVRGTSQVHIGEYFTSGTGRTVLTASSATEYAFEGDDLTSSEARPSVFTGALVDGLRTGSADLDGDGDVSVDELYDYACHYVRDRRSAQQPQKWSFETTGTVIIARSPRAAPLPEQLVSDMASDRLVLRLHAVDELSKLLSGSKAGLRESAAVALRDLGENDDSRQVRTRARSALAGHPMPVVDQIDVAEGRSRAQATAGPERQPERSARIDERHLKPGQPQGPTRQPARPPAASHTSVTFTVAGVLAGVGFLLFLMATSGLLATYGLAGTMEDVLAPAALVPSVLVAVGCLLLVGPKSWRPTLAAALVGAAVWIVPPAVAAVDRLLTSERLEDASGNWALVGFLVMLAAGFLSARTLPPFSVMGTHWPWPAAT